MDGLHEIFNTNHKMIPYLKLVEKTNTKVSVQINLTNSCPSRCKSCRKYEWPHVDLDVNKVNELIHWLYSNGCETVTFSGGEPLSYKDLNKIIIPDGLKVNVLTSLITSGENVAWLIKNADSVQVSLDAADRDLYEKIRGVDAFNTVFRNLCNLGHSIGKVQRLRINCTLSKMNIGYIEQLLEIASVFPTDINFYPVHTWPEMMLDEVDYDYINEFAFDYLFEGGIFEFKESEIKTNLHTLKYEPEKQIAPVCIIPKIHAVIDSNGDVYPCCRLLDDNGDYKTQSQFSYGNIYRDSFPKLFNYNVKGLPVTPECRQCDRYKSINDLYYQYQQCNQQLYL